MKDKISKRKTILITCAGGSGPIYLAKKLSRRFNIVMVDADGQNAGSQLGFPFFIVPFGGHPSYSKVLGRITKQHHVDIIVPGADEELMAVADMVSKNTSLIGVLPRKQFLKICINKKNLMTALHRENISHLLPFTSKSSVRYPVIVKPILGHGSRGVHVINSKAQLEGYLKLYGKHFSDVLVQPYAGGEEYTVSVIVNNLNQLIGIVPKRIIVKKGITRAAVTEKNAQIEIICRKIVDKFKPGGPFNVQLKIDRGNVYIFEINPRLSTTAVLTEHAFGNEVELFIKYFNRNSLPAFPKMKAPLYLYRYEENVFK